MNRVFNFGAGPAMLPTEVMEKAQQEFLDYNTWAPRLSRSVIVRRNSMT